MTASDDDLRRRAEARVETVDGFRVHLVIYLLVNALLWAIWAMSGANLGAAWPIFVTLGWGIGLAAHWWSVYGRTADGREARVQAEMEKLRQRKG
jgi:RsiW-degrading membrane proteinase PrsW (M82 family)